MMPHLHLSLQAGDDLILKRMKRRHLRADAIAFCDQVRRLRPDVVFGGDIIAGFPTETEAMFARSLDLVDECGLTHLHVFPFSARPGTPAARMPAVAPAIVKERARRAAPKGRGGAAPPSRRRDRGAPPRARRSARAAAAPSNSPRCGSRRRPSPAQSSISRSRATTAGSCWPPCRPFLWPTASTLCVVPAVEPGPILRSQSMGHGVGVAVLHGTTLVARPPNADVFRSLAEEMR